MASQRVTAAPDRPSLHFLAVRVTHEDPSKNLVLNSTFALLNISSFRETIMNCEGRRASATGQQSSDGTHLRVREVGFDHVAYVGRVTLVQCCVHFVKDVDGCRVVAKESQDE